MGLLIHSCAIFLISAIFLQYCGADLGTLHFFTGVFFSSALATFTSLPNVLLSGNTIQLVVGFNNRIPLRVQAGLLS